MIPKELEHLDLNYFSHGKRSKIYTYTENGKMFAVKIEDDKIKNKGRIENEVKFLNILNKQNIGSRVLHAGKKYFIYEFVEGSLILDFIEKSKNPFPVLKNILRQCQVLDELKINKLEMHHPMKHIFIKKKKVVLIDFERCYFTEKPKNVTQFCQFLIRSKKLSLNKEKIIAAVKEYKKENSEKNFKKVLACLI